MTKGRLAALKGPWEYDILEFPVPQAMEGSLVIKVEAASICGSDQHFVKAGYYKPMCEGHEFTGKIVDMGTHANDSIHCYGGDLKVGDRIAVYPWITCGKCDSCMTHGDGVCGTCENGFIYGGPINDGEGVLNCDPFQSPHFKGGFGDYVHIFPRTYVWKVPDDMPPTIATLLDPTAVAMRAIEMAMTEAGVLQEGVNTSSTVLVIGAGPIGVITGLILKTMGVEKLIFSDMVQGKLDNAKDITGADVIFNVKGMDSEERIAKLREMTHGGADIVINCANHYSSSIEGMQMAKVLGTFVEVGNTMEFMGSAQPSISLAKVLFSRNVRITSLVANYPKSFDNAFRLLKRHKTIPFHRLITHEFYKLEGLLPTMKKMGDDDYLKGVLVNKD